MAKTYIITVADEDIEDFEASFNITPESILKKWIDIRLDNYRAEKERLQSTINVEQAPPR